MSAFLSNVTHIAAALRHTSSLIHTQTHMDEFIITCTAPIVQRNMTHLTFMRTSTGFCLTSVPQGQSVFHGAEVFGEAPSLTHATLMPLRTSGRQ